MKARYTSLQTDTGSAEEHWADLADITSIDGMPVVAAALHSQVPAIAALFKQQRPTPAPCLRHDRRRRIPLALSDLVAVLRDRDADRLDDHVRPRVRWRPRGGFGVQRVGRRPGTS